MKTVLTITCIILAQAAQAQSLSLTAGDYRWTSDWGCSDLTIGSTFAYTYDDGCDGSVDYTARNVTLSGNTVRADDAIFTIEAADANQISGIFDFNGLTPATFVRQ